MSDGLHDLLECETIEAVITAPAGISLTLHVSDPETCAELEEHAEGRPRHNFAVSALKIGVLALRHARGRIDTDRIREEGDRLVEKLGSALADHQRGVIEQLTANLKEYFDPQSGRFNERVERLIKRDGELEQLLRDHVGGDGSELVRTLSGHIGEQSPLMQVLDPDAPGGLLAAIGAAVTKTVTEQREQLLQQFSLDNKDGALSRLVAELTEKHADASGILAEHVKTAVSEFSLDREDSALSRLVKRVEQAQRQISSEFSLDDEASALARMKRKLFDLIDASRKANDEFHRQVLQKLADATARKEEARRSTRHGHEFEDAVYEEIDAACQAAGDLAEHTGTTTGLIKHCKKGDIVVELGRDHAAAGARIVIEAKEQSSFSIRDALVEIEQARKNRDAGVGLVIISARTAPSGAGPLCRHGNDVVIVWDSEDCSSDVNLFAGLSVAKAICTKDRARSEAEATDFLAIEGAIRNIEKRLEDLDQISTWAGTVQSNGEKIARKASSMKVELAKQISTLDQKVGGLGEILGVPT